jgi:hypothetical protein
VSRPSSRLLPRRTRPQSREAVCARGSCPDWSYRTREGDSRPSSRGRRTVGGKAIAFAETPDAARASPGSAGTGASSYRLIAATGIRPHGRQASRVKCGDRCRYSQSASTTRSLKRALGARPCGSLDQGEGCAAEGDRHRDLGDQGQAARRGGELAQQAEASYGRMGAGWQAAAAKRVGASVTPGRIVQAGTTAGAMRRPRRSAARSRPSARAAGRARGSSW